MVGDFASLPAHINILAKGLVTLPHQMLIDLLEEKDNVIEHTHKSQAVFFFAWSLS